MLELRYRPADENQAAARDSFPRDEPSEESILEWVCKGGRFTAAGETGRIDSSEWATFGQEPVKPGTYSNLLVDGDGEWTFRIST